MKTPEDIAENISSRLSYYYPETIRGADLFNEAIACAIQAERDHAEVLIKALEFYKRASYDELWADSGGVAELAIDKYKEGEG